MHFAMDKPPTPESNIPIGALLELLIGLIVASSTYFLNILPVFI